MQPGDYAAARALWEASPGIGLSDADTESATTRFLSRNPGTSFVATDGGHLVGTLLCGHDGRRGYAHHLAVATSHRGRGTARELVRRCLDALAALGIRKCHALVLADNADGLAFWEHVGWTERGELRVVSKWTGEVS